MRSEVGSASLLTVLLLPLIVLVLSAVVDLGLLRLGAARVRSAADLAAVIAVNDQDEPAVGALRLAGDAESVARHYLAANLATTAPLLAASAASIATAADIAVFPTGGVDPIDGARYDRPTVRIRAAVPLRTGGLRAVLGPNVLVHAIAAAAAR